MANTPVVLRIADVPCFRNCCSIRLPVLHPLDLLGRGETELISGLPIRLSGQ
jgi:hypothetical protein